MVARNASHGMVKMDKPSCDNCGTETQWYGWTHGWLCSACDAADLQEEAEDEAVEQQKEKNPSPQAKT